MQDTIGQALTHEQERLATILSTYLSPSDQDHLNQLLEDAPGLYEITQLKREPKDFSASEITREIREFSRDHKSSEQFVWLNRRHREMETQLAPSSVAFDDTNSASGGVDLGSFSGYGLPWVV